MQSDYLILVLAVVTIGIVAAVAIWQRGRVARAKGDPARSSFTREHGEAPRQNRPGTEH